MTKKGFTLVEVAIFLALTGVLIIVAIAGTTRNMAEKRYNDTVSNFESYLEGIYTSVYYVEHDGNGSNDKAVYGKLVDMKTETVSGETKTTFTSYSVIGAANVNGKATDALEQLLKQTPELIDSSAKTYSPNWEGKIHVENNEQRVLLLVIHHPKTGMVSTYAYRQPSVAADLTTTNIKNLLESTDPTDSTKRNFQKQDIDFCVDSDDRWAVGNERRLIRIHQGASNSSGIELMSNDQKGSLCP